MQTDYFQNWSFDSDTPITSIGQDVLQRGPMAKRLATLICNVVESTDGQSADPIDSAGQRRFTIQDSSFTVAVCGPWGSGKTSFKNLVALHMQDHPAGCPHVVEFSPRQWSSQEAVIHAFFNSLAQAVGEDDSQNARNAKEFLERLGSILTWGAQITNLAAALGITLGAYQGDPTLMVAAAPALAAKSAAESTGGKLFNWKLKKKEKHDKAKADRSLSELQRDATAAMRNINRPVLVWIDDIDRLTGHEISNLFQLLKFNADFPNVIYVLLADRTVLQSGLDTLFPGAGRTYLEKFIQLFIDLPRVGSDILQRQFLSGMVPLTKELTDIEPALPARLTALYPTVFAPYLSTMRRFRLYMNRLHFVLPIWRESTASANIVWNVSPLDAILLELLRLHEPRVHEDMSDAKSLLTSPFVVLGAAGIVKNIERDKINHSTDTPESKKRQLCDLDERMKSAAQKLIESMCDHAENPKTVLTLLEHLFPNLRILFQQMKDGDPVDRSASTTPRQWSINKRLCSPRFFDRYFALRVSTMQLNAQEQSRLTESSASRTELIAAIRELSSNGRTDDVLEELSLLADRLSPPKRIEDFVIAVIDWADEISVPQWQAYNVGGRWVRICGIIHDVLARCGSIEEALATFENAAKKATGIYAVLLCASPAPYVSLNYLGGYYENQLRILAPQEAAELKQRFVHVFAVCSENAWERLRQLTSCQGSGLPLTARSCFGPLLRWWSDRDRPEGNGESPISVPSGPEANGSTVGDWPSKMEVQTWVADLVASPSGFASFGRMAALINPIWEDENPMPEPDQMFELLKIEDFATLESLYRQSREIDFSSLPQYENAWARTFADALEQHHHGQRLPYFIRGSYG